MLKTLGMTMLLLGPFFAAGGCDRKESTSPGPQPGDRSAAGAAAAAELSVQIDGKAVVFDCQKLNHKVVVEDQGKGGRGSILSCSFLYRSFLADGLIDKASEITTEPEQAKAKWNGYRKRVGPDAFKKAMSGYFTEGNVVVADIGKGKLHMLLITVDGDTAAQFYLATDGGYSVVELPPDSEEAKSLGRLFELYKDGKVRIPD